MTIFDALKLIGGLCLFLFGMNIMGQALERRAGGKLQSLLAKLTTKKAAGLVTGIGVTSVIQSSSATTVMVVGFVNSGLMTLKQAINVIMGANIGTTVTAWILSLGGIESSNVFVKLLKPTSFTPILALIGIVFYMFSKNYKRKDTGTILLGFAVLMFGMDTMSGAVSGLSEVEAFKNLFILFKNPILGVIAGAVLTAVIQSSSASVGILQALAMTGAVSYGAAIPIIMGQNIGTCITAILSSFGTNRNAKRAALVHLSFNVIGSAVWLGIFSIINYTVSPALFSESATLWGISVAHTAFNILCTLLLLPMSSLLEKLAYKLVPETKQPELITELDERLLITPPLALQRCNDVAFDMAKASFSAIKGGLELLENYDEAKVEEIHRNEELTDHYEDILGSYLVKLSRNQVSEHDSAEAARILNLIGDLERISDHGVNLIKSAEELKQKQIVFTDSARKEFKVLCAAVNEILDITYNALMENDVEIALKVEPLEQVIDSLKKKLRANHIARLQEGKCTIDVGFVWADLLTNLERTSDHCSNIAGGIIDMPQHNMNIHENLREIRNDSADFRREYEAYSEKYAIV